MNPDPLENLENLLRGCPLRPPSPKVKAALFAGPPSVVFHPTAATQPPPAHRFQVWFAPLAAATVVALSVAPVWLSSVGPAAEEVAVASLAAAGDPPFGLVEHNALPRPSFRSTIGASVASSFGSLLLRQTNILAR